MSNTYTGWSFRTKKNTIQIVVSKKESKGLPVAHAGILVVNRDR